MGVNSKAETSRARKNAVESERKDRESREKEDQYWREAEGAKPRAAKKREEEAEKRAEAAAKKAEVRRLAELEEKELEKSIKKPDKKANQASTVDDAIAHLAISDSLPPDRHPEKRLRAAFKAFEEAELRALKEEKPGLTHTQYKDLIWKLWKKSPDNPLNQVADKS
uniref:Coiled-coil domain-containing protein n=1 Tax=Solanum lycopersicum TaxID=4081 RepID=A0A3Q7EUP5_SOLLC